MKCCSTSGFTRTKYCQTSGGLTMRPGKSRQSLMVGLAPGMIHPEDLGDELGFHLAPGLGVQVGDLDQVIVIQDLLGNPQGVGIQAHRGDTAALAVAPVVHLHRGLKDVPAGHRHAAGKTGDPAAAFVIGLINPARGKGRGKFPAGVE